MPYADKTKQKEYQKKHYLDNKDKYIAKVDKKRTCHRKLVQEIQKLKESNPCVDCKKYFSYYVMDFDHRSNEIKIACVGAMVGKHCKRSTILEEIAKCDIVCANCHRTRTWQRKYGKMGEPGLNHPPAKGTGE